MEEAVIESASLVKKGEYNKVHQVMLKAMRQPEGFAPRYYDFFDDQSYKEYRTRPKIYKMLSNIMALDAIINGYKEKWLVTILGATKGGKTWWLVETAFQAILQGLNVLFISLEMGKEMIDERFDQIIGFATNKPIGQATDIMRKIEGKWVQQKAVAPSIYDINRAEEERRKIQKLGGGSLKIMAFDRGRLNYHDIDAVLDELVLYEGWVCDVLVVDYLGEMKETAPGQSKKERISENCAGLKEIAAVRNLISFSAMQGNRKAMTSEVFHSHLVADDIGTIFRSDLVLAICQTKVEEMYNRYRMYVANFRHGRQHGMIGMVRDFEIGQVVLDTYEIKQDEEEDDELQEGIDY
jgi:hypothetical protein